MHSLTLTSSVGHARATSYSDKTLSNHRFPAASRAHTDRCASTRCLHQRGIFIVSPALCAHVFPVNCTVSARRARCRFYSLCPYSAERPVLNVFCGRGPESICNYKSAGCYLSFSEWTLVCVTVFFFLGKKSVRLLFGFFKSVCVFLRGCITWLF